MRGCIRVQFNDGGCLILILYYIHVHVVNFWTLSEESSLCTS